MADLAKANGVALASLAAFGGKSIFNTHLINGLVVYSTDQFIQSRMTIDQTYRTFAAAQFPQDGTLPQKTEGAEYAQMATTFTPKGAGNTLIIEYSVCCQVTTGVYGAQVFIFKEVDGVTADDTIGGGAGRDGQFNLGDPGFNVHGSFKITAGTVLPITFHMRVGFSVGTAKLNDNGYVTEKYMFSSLKITEVVG